jgi:hypothetical protein
MIPGQFHAPPNSQPITQTFVSLILLSPVGEPQGSTPLATKSAIRQGPEPLAFSPGLHNQLPDIHISNVIISYRPGVLHPIDFPTHLRKSAKC